jgi:hypothetical protein
VFIEHAAQVEIVLVETDLAVDEKLQKRRAGDNDRLPPFEAGVTELHGPAYESPITVDEVIDEIEIDLFDIGVEMFEICAQIFQAPDFVGRIDEVNVLGVNLIDAVDVFPVQGLIEVEEFLHG